MTVISIILFALAFIAIVGSIANKVKPAPGKPATTRSQLKGGIIFGISCLLIGWWAWPGGSNTNQTTKTEEYKLSSNLSKKQIDSIARDSTIKALFSEWDGSDKALVEYVKSNMNDADSFENVDTRYFDYGDHIVINMKYRGKNIYGAKVLNFIKAKQNIDGSNLDIIETQP